MKIKKVIPENASFQVYFTEVSLTTSEGNQLSYFQNGYFFKIFRSASASSLHLKTSEYFTINIFEYTFVSFYGIQSLEGLLKKRFCFWYWKNYGDGAVCPSSLHRFLWLHRSYFLSPLFWSLSLDGDYHDVQTTKSMALLKVAKPRKVSTFNFMKTNQDFCLPTFIAGAVREFLL